ncbi:hypothetical protein ES708_02362 [subsurface metagenome]
MKLYKLTFIVEDEIKAESRDAAFDIITARLDKGYYGPTQDNLELLEELPEETPYSPTPE